MTPRARHVVIVIGAVAMLAAMAAAQEPAPPQRAIPPEYQNVGVSEHPNAQVPLDLMFMDERGQMVPLGQFFHTGRPVVLQLGYYGCPMLCDVISRNLIDSAKEVELNAGSDYQFVFVSINPLETADLAGLKKRSFIAEYDRPGTADGFHCLVGQDRNIAKLAGAVGFRYKRLELAGQFAHPAVLFVLTPDGRISRYLYGLSLPPRTLKLALVEASAGKIGSSWDKLALMICCYDVDSGRYALAAMRLMRVAAVGTVLVMGLGGLWLFRQGSHARQA